MSIKIGIALTIIKSANILINILINKVYNLWVAEDGGFDMGLLEASAFGVYPLGWWDMLPGLCMT